MARYSHSFVNKTLDTTADTWTVVTTATGAGSAVGVYRLFFGGESSSSTVARTAVTRPSVAGTTPTNATLAKLNPASGANTFNVSTAWSVQPTLGTSHVLAPTINTFGNQYLFVAPPGSEIIVGTQGAVANLSFRSLTGVPVISGEVLIEEY